MPEKVRFSLRAAFFATTVLILLFGMIVAGMRHADRGYTLTNCRVALDCTHSALWRYAEANGGRLPTPSTRDAAGKDIGSWRFQVVEYSGFWDTTLHGKVPDLTAAWDAHVNRSLASTRPFYFCADRLRRSLNTTVFAVTGPDTVFPPAGGRTAASLPGCTIVAMEVADSKTHWMQPGDYDVTKLLSQHGRVGDHLPGLLPDRLHVLFADGEIWAISADAPMTALHPFLTITGAKTRDREQDLEAYRSD